MRAEETQRETMVAVRAELAEGAWARWRLGLGRLGSESESVESLSDMLKSMLGANGGARVVEWLTLGRCRLEGCLTGGWNEMGVSSQSANERSRSCSRSGMARRRANGGRPRGPPGS